MKLTITGGRIYDPANGLDGVERTLFVEPFPTAQAERDLDAAGCVVFPGGVDMHCHIAGPAVHRARRLVSVSEHRRGPHAPKVPTAIETARLYSSIG